MEFTHLECEMATPRGMNRENGMRQVRKRNKREEMRISQFSK